MNAIPVLVHDFQFLICILYSKTWNHTFIGTARKRWNMQYTQKEILMTQCGCAASPSTIFWKAHVNLLMIYQTFFHTMQRSQYGGGKLGFMFPWTTLREKHIGRGITRLMQILLFHVPLFWYFTQQFYFWSVLQHEESK